MPIAFDSAASATKYNSADTFSTVSLTIGSGSNRMLAGFGSYEKQSGQTANDASSITYNGTNLIFSVRSTSGTVLDHSEGWYLGESALPSAGTYNLTVTWPTAKRSNQISGILMTGVKDQAPEAVGSNNNTSDVSSGSVNITTITNNSWLAGVIEQGTAFVLSFDTATQRATASDATSVVQVGTELIASSGAVSLDWSSTGSKRWSGSVLAFELASGGTVYFQTVLGSITLSGTLYIASVFVKLVSGSIIASGSLVKLTSKIVSGSITATGALLKRTFLTLLGSITGGGLVSKRTSKSFIGSITASSILTVSSVFLSSLSGSITLNGAISKRINKILSGSITVTGTIVKRISKIITSFIVATGNIIKNTRRFISGSITASGMLQTVFSTYQSISGSIIASGVLTSLIVGAAAAIVRRVRHGIQLILGTQKR